MTFWYDTHPVAEASLSRNMKEPLKLHMDNITNQEAVSPMPKFDEDRALKIMMEGSEEEKSSLVKELAAMLEHKSYGLVWEHGGTSANSPFEADNVVLECDKGIPYPVLREDLSLFNERAVNGRNNLLLEGDNYIWLKILEQTHCGKIDVIYIDPPYNTGKKDFKYNDSFVGEDDIYRQSKWLDFMDKRLRIARELLKDDGVIFISIDEHNLYEIGMLCNEIFDKNNYVENFIWVKSVAKNLSKTTSTEHEYVLCYAKNIKCVENNSTLFRVPKGGYNEALAAIDEVKNTGGTPKDAEDALRALHKANPEWKWLVNHLHVDDDFSMFIDGDLSAPKASGIGRTYDVFHPVTQKPCKVPKRGWGMTEETMNKMIENGNIMFFEDETRSPRVKKKLEELTTQVQCSVINNAYLGKKELDDIFGISPFNNPKPTSLIQTLLSSFGTDYVVLDFFAGSGTTAQAVEELNVKDGGHRKWILVTNNEDQDANGDDSETGICRDITKPRIDTIITGIRPDGSRYSEGCDSGYAYYQYKFIDRIKRQYQRNAYAFFRPYIVDALIPLSYGAHKVVQDEKKMLCIYENDTQRIIAFYSDTDANSVQAVIDEYQTDDKTPIVLLPEDAAEFKSNQIEQLRNGIEVKRHHSLINRAGYLK